MVTAQDADIIKIAHHVNRMNYKNTTNNPIYDTITHRDDVIDELLNYLKVVESFDTRRQSKVLHKLSDIIGISLFAMIANANDPEEIEMFSKVHESFLREHFELANGISSHRYNRASF